MAGTIQTLILTPSPTKSLLFRHRNLHFPAKHAILRCHFISSRRSRLTWRSIRACESSNQIESDGENLDRESGSVEGLLWARPLLNFASDNFLPLALLGGVALGLANPGLGLTLRSEDIGDAAEAWPVAILGLVSILLFTPYFSRLILHFRLQPQEFVTGLAIFCCMPTTLSSGVALTQLAGGNSALALAMTVISNLLGILIIPFSISRFIASGVGVSVPTKQLLKSLVVTLLIPLVLGKVLRESFRGIGDFVDQNRKLFSKISAILLSLVPWMQVSRSRSLLLMVKPAVFLVAIGAGALLHLILLAFNVLTIKSLSALSGGGQSVFAKKENSSAFLLVASQKTLPVMVAVVEKLGGAFGESGLLVLPCVAAHLNQIILDSFLVNFWLRKDTSNRFKVS
ncbi:probable sodium/metabolite cotransporter BASS4, chloroplastic isoform X2 [Morus notabilis]|uniref:probable sodium/metabolite cotransporter BASS4, chloroplastic isoform X2 n=1 Tax=Morus notabilis TaxID=981085 RepID=UPI000CECE663|nr:probable sodium/metabolite cotransporter BASS4, chloroplastic isoform X2 [Morus notabilis]